MITPEEEAGGGATPPVQAVPAPTPPAINQPTNIGEAILLIGTGLFSVYLGVTFLRSTLRNKHLRSV